MDKVGVKRHVSEKRPDYAPMESSDEEHEEFQFIKTEAEGKRQSLRNRRIGLGTLGCGRTVFVNIWRRDRLNIGQ